MTHRSRPPSSHLVEDAAEQRGGRDHPDGAVAELRDRLRDPEHLLAVDDDAPARHRAAGQVREQPAQAHLRQRVDGQWHQALAPEHPARRRSDMDASPRRRTGGRSARVTRAVHVATMHVLTEHGLDGLAVEDVAARAGVTRRRSTVAGAPARRWSPTR